VLTIEELERWLALQIAGVYHLKVHSTLGKTPLVAWREGLIQRKQPQQYPVTAEEFFLDFHQRSAHALPAGSPHVFAP
jgi:putative transposase